MEDKYEEFKKEMEKRGHEVYRKKKNIIVKPNNNYNGYREGFESFYEPIEGFEDIYKVISCDHYNKWIYSLTLLPRK